MRPAQASDRRTLKYFGPRLATSAALAFAVLASVEGVLFHLTIYINHDIAWILDSTRRLLQGGRYGIDIIEPNPPLIWWLSAPLVMVSDVANIFVADMYVVVVAGISIALLTCLFLLVWRSNWRFANGEVLLAIMLAAYMLFQGSYRDYGQREYLALVLGGPYLLAAAGRLRGASINPFLALLIGILAGIGYALKPYFLAVPLLVEAYCWSRTRGRRFLLRGEIFGLAGVGVLYGIFLFVLEPEWIHNVVPIVGLTFGAFERSAFWVAFEVFPYVLGLSLVGLWVARQRGHDLLVLLFLTACGFGISYFAQMKGYSYHAFPLKTLTIVCLAMISGRIVDDAVRTFPQRPTILVRNGLYLVALGTLLVLNWNQVASWRRLVVPGGPAHRSVTEIINLTDGHEAFLALSTHPFPGFPTSLYVDAAWVPLTNSRWLLPAVARARANPNDSNAYHRQEVEKLAWQMLAADLKKAPGIVFVDSTESHHGMWDLHFHILDFYLENEEIARLWTAYQEVTAVGKYRVFVRQPESPHLQDAL